MNKREITILLIEDDPGHARLIEKNLKRYVTNKIIRLSDGQQAVDFLFSEGEYAQSVRPSPLMVLLDLNMPVIDGYEVLRRMKKEDRTKKIPVIVLTSTDDIREVSRCYDLGCNVYIVKPVDYEKFSEAMQKLGLLISIVVVPEGE
ncbi:MAG: response regulator [Smithella sp.]